MGKIDFTVELSKESAQLYCILCKKEKNHSQFYVSGSHGVMFRIGNDHKAHTAICKECAQELLEYYYKLYRSKQKALYMLCAVLDIFYDEEIAEQLKNGELSKLASLYLEGYLVACKNNPKTFIDYITAKEELETVVKEVPNTSDTSDDFTEEDLKNRREVVSIFHYDPFEDEPPSLRKKLTMQLCAMCDDSLREDLVRQRAALEIVRSFARIDEWTKSIDAITKDPKKMTTQAKELKMLIDTKAKETEMITKFSKDHGFAERYALAKSRGSGTIGAIMRDMEDFDYDDGRVNAYDIKTSESMQQASDISFQSIMKQLSLGEADYVQMVKTQKEELTKINNELLRTKEELRLVYKEIRKEELLKELATDLIKKGLAKDEVSQAILSEIYYDDSLIQKEKKG